MNDRNSDSQVSETALRLLANECDERTVGASWEILSTAAESLRDAAELLAAIRETIDTYANGDGGSATDALNRINRMVD